MAHKVAGQLAQIEADVFDDNVSLSSLLNKCLRLGGRPESEKLREWASQELSGYLNTEAVPGYRHIPTALFAFVTNSAGYNGMSQRIRASVFPPQIGEMIARDVDVEDAILGWGIGELEALANQGAGEHRLVPSWAEFIVDVLNQFNAAPNSHVTEVYWTVSNASIQGLLVRVRARLAESVAELMMLVSQDQVIPEKIASDQAIHLVVGDHATINFNYQHTSDGGTNVSIGYSASGTVIVSGKGGTAIGSQTASGPNSSVVGSQSAQGAHSTITGRDAVSAADEQPDGKNWWVRLRKRGVAVAVSTIIAGIVGIFQWIGWMPWQHAATPNPTPSSTSSTLK